MTTRHRRTTAPRLFAGLAAGLVLAAAGPVSAQGLEAGVRGGVNLSTTATEGDPRGLGWRTGLVGGGFLVWPLPGGLALQPEALYTSKGAKYDEAGIDARLVLDYLEIPVLVRVPMPAVGGAYVAAGPALALRLRARTRTDFGGAIEELDIAADVERTDVGIVVAGGFAVGRILIDGRYTHGLADVDREEAVAVRNRTVSLTAGLRF